MTEDETCQVAERIINDAQRACRTQSVRECITLGRADALLILWTCEYREREIIPPWANGCPTTETDILYNGEWLTLGRTDAFDDVRTGSGYPPYTIACAANANPIGARIAHGHFFVIDSLTDG